MVTASKIEARLTNFQEAGKLTRFFFLEAGMLRIDVFDFDGTIFNSPVDSRENHEIYEKATGIPWLIDKELSRKLTKEHGKFIPMRRGWWGRPETLEPPLVPVPAPKELFNKDVCKAFFESKKDPDALTMILTGRHAGLKGQVLRICDEGGLVAVEKRQSKEGKTYYDVADENVICHFLGEDGPKPKGQKPGETFPWKVWLIEQFVKLHEVEKVQFWEDRKEHVTKFKELNGVLASEVVVYEVE